MTKAALPPRYYKKEFKIKQFWGHIEYWKNLKPDKNFDLLTIPFHEYNFFYLAHRLGLLEAMRKALAYTEVEGYNNCRLLSSYYDFLENVKFD